MVNSKISVWLKAAGLSTALVISGGIVSHFEGKSNTAYLDPVNIWTICYGETKNVKKGDYKTDEDCLQSLAEDLVSHDKQMMALISVPINDHQHAAFLSFSYNVGVGAFSRSTLLKKLNASQYRAACDELLRWNKAKGKVLNGLTARREAERKLCLGEI